MDASRSPCNFFKQGDDLPHGLTLIGDATSGFTLTSGEPLSAAAAADPYGYEIHMTVHVPAGSDLGGPEGLDVSRALLTAYASASRPAARAQGLTFGDQLYPPGAVNESRAYQLACRMLGDQATASALSARASSFARVSIPPRASVDSAKRIVVEPLQSRAQEKQEARDQALVERTLQDVRQRLRAHLLPAIRRARVGHKGSGTGWERASRWLFSVKGGGKLRHPSGVEMAEVRAAHSGRPRTPRRRISSPPPTSPPAHHS
jgi:hypothetical protein